MSVRCQLQLGQFQDEFISMLSILRPTSRVEKSIMWMRDPLYHWHVCWAQLPLLPSTYSGIIMIGWSITMWKGVFKWQLIQQVIWQQKASWHSVMQARKMKETTLVVQAIVFQQLFSSMSPREVSNFKQWFASFLDYQYWIHWISWRLNFSHCNCKMRIFNWVCISINVYELWTPVILKIQTYLHLNLKGNFLKT